MSRLQMMEHHVQQNRECEKMSIVYPFHFRWFYFQYHLSAKKLLKKETEFAVKTGYLHMLLKMQQQAECLEH